MGGVKISIWRRLCAAMLAAHPERDPRTILAREVVG
jgi:hypothetical protein